MGYLEIDGGQPDRAKRRYLAYWVRRREGWRVAALKQALQGKDEVIVPMQPPALPARHDRARSGGHAAHRQSLIAAEKAFSDRAQVAGLRQAFQEFGRDDAIHVFGQNSFRVGSRPSATPAASRRPGLARAGPLEREQGFVASVGRSRSQHRR